MIWFSSIFKAKPKPARRRVVNVATLHSLLQSSTSGLRSQTHAIRLSDRDYASVTRAEVERIARQVWEPWVRDIADCDDQALFLTAACRKAAFAEGGHIPWGVGFIFTAGENAHAYTWALVLTTSDTLQINFFDQTTGQWLPAQELDKPITLTFG